MLSAGFLSPRKDKTANSEGRLYSISFLPISHFAFHLTRCLSFFPFLTYLILELSILPVQPLSLFMFVSVPLSILALSNIEDIVLILSFSLLICYEMQRSKRCRSIRPVFSKKNSFVPSKRSRFSHI